MLEIIKQTALHTPWWVYLLLYFLLKMGFKAASTRVVSVKVLFIGPVVFTFMAIETLINNFKITGFDISIFSIALITGAAIGWYQVSTQSLRLDKENWLIEIPGSWSVLIIIIIIFASKYYFGYELSVDPEIAHNTLFETAFVGVTAGCTGIFVGKLLCYLHRLQKGPHQDLLSKSE